MIKIKDYEYFQKLLPCLHGTLLYTQGMKSFHRLTFKSNGIIMQLMLYGNLFKNVSCGANVSAEFYQPLLHLCCDPHTTPR